MAAPITTATPSPRTTTPKPPSSPSPHHHPAATPPRCHAIPIIIIIIPSPSSCHHHRDIIPPPPPGGGMSVTLPDIFPLRHIFWGVTYMAKIQEVISNVADNFGPIFDTEPLQKVHNTNDDYNVFSNVRQHLKQPKFVNDTYLVEQGYPNMTSDSSDMSGRG
ncbi:hypothetical protein Tco_1193919 [Tanacetum coccineum]